MAYVRLGEKPTNNVQLPIIFPAPGNLGICSIQQEYGKFQHEFFEDPLAQLAVEINPGSNLMRVSISQNFRIPCGQENQLSLSYQAYQELPFHSEPFVEATKEVAGQRSVMAPDFLEKMKRIFFKPNEIVTLGQCSPETESGLEYSFEGGKLIEVAAANNLMVGGEEQANYLTILRKMLGEDRLRYRGILAEEREKLTSRGINS